MVIWSTIIWLHFTS